MTDHQKRRVEAAAKALGKLDNWDWTIKHYSKLAEAALSAADAVLPDTYDPLTEFRTEGGEVLRVNPALDEVPDVMSAGEFWDTQLENGYISGNRAIAVIQQRDAAIIAKANEEKKKLARILRNYTFLDEGMDAETRPEIYREAKQALADVREG